MTGEYWPMANTGYNQLREWPMQ